MALLASMILATTINNLGKLFISSKNIIETFDTDNKSLFSYFLELGTKGECIIFPHPKNI